MADTQTKADSAEKAYAEAAAETNVAKAPAADAAPAPEPAAESAPPTKTVAATKPEAAKKTAAKKTVAAKKAAAPKKTAAKLTKTKKPARKPASKIALAKSAKRAARVAKAAAAPAAVKSVPKLSVTQLKEKIMATAKTTDFTKPMTDAVGELQTRAQAAIEKSTEVAAEVTEFTKGNVEAFVESSKIFAAGAQTLGKTYVEEAKSAYETITADVKEMAAVKSPTELFQLQGKILRRNFDIFVATSTKNGEAVAKLANDTFAPLTGRVNVAAEKLSKAA